MKVDQFIIKGDNWKIKLKIDEVWDFPNKTCSWGGYDTFSSLTIKSEYYSAKGQFPLSTGEIYNFYSQLQNSFDKLNGKAELISYEGHINLRLEFDNQGHVNILGKFIAQTHIQSEFQFEFQTDQSFLSPTLNSLRAIYNKYGDNSGINANTSYNIGYPPAGTIA